MKRVALLLWVLIFSIFSTSYSGIPGKDSVASYIQNYLDSSTTPTADELRFGEEWLCRTFSSVHLESTKNIPLVFMEENTNVQLAGTAIATFKFDESGKLLLKGGNTEFFDREYSKTDWDIRANYLRGEIKKHTSGILFVNIKLIRWHDDKIVDQFLACRPSTDSTLDTSSILNYSIGSLIPLSHSKWIRENPGKLPYEECHFEAYDYPSFKYKSYSPLIYGEYSDTRYNANVHGLLVCTSEKIGTIFAIPIKISGMNRAGVFATWFMEDVSFRSAKIKNLSGKKLSQLASSFNGVHLSARWLIGVGYRKVSNKDNISIKFPEGLLHGDLGVSISKFGFNIVLRNDLLMYEYLTDFVVLDSDLQHKNYAWDVFETDFNREKTVELSDTFRELEFVKID